MDDLLFKVIQVVVLVLFTMIGRYVIPWLREKLGNEKATEAIKWAGIAVNAAEQVITGEKMGADKKTYVVEKLKKILTAKNIALSDEQFDLLVESAVNTMNAEAKKQ